MDATLRKQHGVHYTPPELARFLARQVTRCLVAERTSEGSENNDARRRFNRPVTLLDPACGDGGLLNALVDELRESFCLASEMVVVGYELDAAAAQAARDRLETLGLASVCIYDEDFLSRDDGESQFDFVIANPPYVRTQVLGGAESQRLARKFELDGRVDLYQAFTISMGQALTAGGVMGLLTSNRFLTVKSGAAMRQLLRSEFEVRQIIDLGDSRLFDAAVLPVIVAGVKRDGASSGSGEADAHVPRFCRISRIEDDRGDARSTAPSLLDTIDDGSTTGRVATRDGKFQIKRGELSVGEGGAVWALANRETKRWLATVRENQHCRFGDLAEIKVGIKTTADAVFIRDEWESLGEQQPEVGLLKPLLTHHVAGRWSGRASGKWVLYPYDLSKPKRTPVKIEEFPRARRYLESHRERLAGRRYLIDAGRRWYEIWVAHQPTDWAMPKIVWPDISEQPKFFLDQTGAIVNGDCYWIKLREGVDPDWLYLMLGVANSSIATRYYDTVFHNKLYAGRRRFMTQYVNDFPLPELESPVGRRIVERVKPLVERPLATDGATDVAMDEGEVERLVAEAFGF